MSTAAPLRLSRSVPDGAMARANQTLTLKDGRRLGFAQFGSAGAPPVFYFHGWPGSRFEAGFFDVSGVQMVGVDRPGYGLSDPHKDRKLGDWPKDIRALADHLGFEKFGVVGMSGGGPYAAACAHYLGDRVTRAAIIAGLGPPDAPGMRDQRVGFLLNMGQRPWGSGVLLNVMRTVALSKIADKRIAVMRERLPPGSKDRDVLSPAMLQMLLASFREGLKTSVKGPQSDARIYGEDWGFKLSDIRVPVRIWHGTADLQVPVSIGRHYASHIPNATGVFPEGEGHISIIVNYLEAVIADVRTL
jgi:pimeloyl-ACP methyl ester carboxylesterase